MVVTLCFDDAYEEVYTIGFPILTGYGIRGTLGIITNEIGGSFEGYPIMNLNQMTEMYNSGWEIASHSVTHPSLTDLNDGAVTNELANSKNTLESFGFDVNAFIVPFGAYDDRISGLVSQYYYSCRPSIWGTNSIPVADRYWLKSKWVVNTTSLGEIISWIDDAKANNTWLIIMLHNIDRSEREYNISSENLSAISQYIAEQNINVLNISEVLNPSPEVEQGGTIRETINWDALVGVGTHPFYLFSMYGVGTTESEILANQLMVHWFVKDVATGTYTTSINATVPSNAPIGTYSCLTIIADDFNTTTGDILGIYDSEVDANVLTIVPGLGATIVSTNFMRVAF